MCVCGNQSLQTYVFSTLWLQSFFWVRLLNKVVWHHVSLIDYEKKKNWILVSHAGRAKWHKPNGMKVSHSISCSILWRLYWFLKIKSGFRGFCHNSFRNTICLIIMLLSKVFSFLYAWDMFYYQAAQNDAIVRRVNMCRSNFSITFISLELFHDWLIHSGSRKLSLKF